MAASKTPVSVHIRPAERKDCPAIAGLIMELAVYEKMPEQVKITEKDLERDAFDENPPFFRCLVAEDSSSKTVIGYALYFHTYSTWEGKAIHLEDLCITPKYRRYGVGSQLLHKLAQIAVDGGFCRINFECLEWNESAIKFYEKHHAVNLTKTDKWHAYRFPGDVLSKIAARAGLSSNK